MMTDTQIEAAARELCRLRGLDPDERLTRREASGLPLGRFARWEVVADEVRAAEQVQAALAVGRGAPVIYGNVFIKGPGARGIRLGDDPPGAALADIPGGIPPADQLANGAVGYGEDDGAPD